MESLGAVLPLLLLAVLGYFLLIRPTRRRAQEVSAIQNALAVGAEVMLTSGIFATVSSIEDEQVLVEVAPGVVVRIHRGAIAKIVTPLDEPSTDDDGIDDGDELDADVTDHETGHETDRDARGAN